MISEKTLFKIALSFPESSEQAHFEKKSFRVNKKIFATYDANTKLVCIKLNEIDQNVFSSYDSSIIYPVPNKWGKQGWTFINLTKVSKDLFTDALTTAYTTVAPKKLVALLQSNKI